MLALHVERVLDCLYLNVVLVQFSILFTIVLVKG